MHRLSIMDVDHGWQPFWNEDETVAVLGNGEIYNADVLAAALTDRGHSLRTGSDIEVVPHLFEEEGIDCVRRLRGMFALVIFDKRRNRVFLARDRMGEKPLAFVRTEHWIAFASEQTALVAAGVVSGELDTEVLPDYLMHGYTPEPLSLILGVTKLPAGTVLEIDLVHESSRLTPYWNILDALSDTPLSTTDLRQGLDEAVAGCCTSDVPVGVALSGGLDSSMVATLASRLRPDMVAFTIGYGGSSTDESERAREFAQGLGIPISITQMTSRDVGLGFSKVCTDRDEPIADVAGPAIDAVARAAREAGVPVLLNGLGGDELFWGYEWVRRLGAYSRFHLMGDEGAARRAVRLPSPPRSLGAAAAWVEHRGGRRLESDLAAFLSRWDTGHEPPLALYEFQDGYRRMMHEIAGLCGVSGEFPRPSAFLTGDPVKVAGCYTKRICETYLRSNGLAQTDRLSMRHSVEARTPLVDYRLVDLVMSSRMSGSGGLSEPPKALLRSVAQQILPQHVLQRPKQGFTPPVRRWLADIWACNHDAFGPDSALVGAGLVDASRFEAILRSPRHRSGRVNQLALRLATLELWFRGLPRQVT
jgi:asparagine synthase (glutamine-hydrolysing)